MLFGRGDRMPSYRLSTSYLDFIVRIVAPLDRDQHGWRVRDLIVKI